MYCLQPWPYREPSSPTFLVGVGISIGVGRGGSGDCEANPRLGISVSSAATTSGEASRESGGDMGNSGKSSLNRDLVRFGTPELSLLTGAGAGGIGVVGVGVRPTPTATATAGASSGGTGDLFRIAACISSRDALEKDEGPEPRRLFLLAHLNRDVKDSLTFCIPPELRAFSISSTVAGGGEMVDLDRAASDKGLAVESEALKTFLADAPECEDIEGGG